jgi:hypothetical protein
MAPPRLILANRLFADLERVADRFPLLIPSQALRPG